MKLAAVFAACLALALAGPEEFWFPTVRDIPTNYASEIPVHVAHDFIGKFGLVKPSDDDIAEYANNIGTTDINIISGLRGLYTDPALVLLADDFDNVLAYYADTGINLINAYPETRSVFHSLLDDSNVLAFVYKPERFLIPPERQAVASRFFFPKNFKLRDIGARLPENVPVHDAPVMFKKYEIPVFFLKDRDSYRRFDINRIPYAYKAPVYMKLSDTTSPVWFRAIDSDAKPAFADLTFPNLKVTHDLSVDDVSPLSWRTLCRERPWWCAKFIKVAEDIQTPSTTFKTFPFASETEPSLFRLTDKSYPVDKYNYLSLQDGNRFFINPVPFDSESFKSFRFLPNTEPWGFKTIPPTVPLITSPALPLVASKNIPYTRPLANTVPATTDVFASKRLQATDIPVFKVESPVIPPYLIRPEYLKAATVPVLSPVSPTVATSPVSSPVPTVAKGSFV